MTPGRVTSVAARHAEKELRVTRTRPLCGFVLAVVAAHASAAAAQAPPADAPRITVYGAIVANASAADTQLAVADSPLWALQDTQRLVPPSIGPQQPGSFEAQAATLFIATARQSRFGVRVDVPQGQSGWMPSGRIELDLFGDRPAVPHGSVLNAPRLRLAYVSLQHRSGWALVAGQDTAIFAPADPTSYAHFADPLAAAGGNPWMRLPQLRVDKVFGLGNRGLLIQAGILRPVGGGDAPASGSVADAVELSGERSGVPFVEARVAVTGTAHGRSQAVGISVHHGREKAEPQTLDSWGAALDVAIDLGSHVRLSGEAWRGENLDTFQAGILQGVTQSRGAFRNVAAQGGWVQASLFPSASAAIHAGFGLDDPDDAALTVLAPRAKNQVFWANVMLQPHPHVTFAFEYNHFQTSFRAGSAAAIRTGTGNYGNAAIVLSF